MKPQADGLYYQTVFEGSELEIGDTMEYWFEAESEAGPVGRLPETGAVPSRFSIKIYDPEASGPAITHRPVLRSASVKDVIIEATVEAGRELQAVRLHYRYTNQYYDWIVVEMERSAEGYRAVIPAHYLRRDWDVMYFLEAVDSSGAGTFEPLPKPVGAIPYHVIRVDR
jgi:hypothetical protein